MTYRYLTLAGIFSLLICLIVRCKKDGAGKDDRLPYYKSLDPVSQISELSKYLVVTSGENKSGNAPATNSTADLQIVVGQASASVTNDNLLFIPFLISTSASVSGMYLQLKGADNYWQIPLGAASENVYVTSVGIPPRVTNGDFELLYKLYDAAGKVGDEKEMKVSIVSAQSSCGTNQPAHVEGQDGLTVRTFDMGTSKGKVRIVYDTYTVKDRIDIRYNGQWVRSTGELLDGSSAPPIKPCNLVGNNDGFVGASGTFEFDYDPAVSHKVDIYVSGCLDGGTLWYFDAYCPDATTTAVPKWYDGVPDCPCKYADAVKLGATVDPEGSWKDFGKSDPWYSLHDFHYGSATEVRWLPGEKGRSGQQCNYDAQGNLITGGIAAGSPDLVSPDGVLGLPGGHWDADMKPWWTRSCSYYLENWPANNDNHCAVNVISGITDISKLVGDMTCKEVVDLFKGAESASGIPEDLKKYLIGSQPYIYNGNNARLLEDLKEWQKKECITGLGSTCAAIQKAIDNVGR